MGINSTSRQFTWNWWHDFSTIFKPHLLYRHKVTPKNMWFALCVTILVVGEGRSWLSTQEWFLQASTSPLKPDCSHQLCVLISCPGLLIVPALISEYLSWYSYRTGTILSPMVTPQMRVAFNVKLPAHLHHSLRPPEAPPWLILQVYYTKCFSSRR